MFPEGGCGRHASFDHRTMGAESEDPEWVLKEWQAGRVQRRDLYDAVRGAMKQAARRGIGYITANGFNEHDVDDVVYKSFCELENQDPFQMQTLIGFARRIADMRGRDRGRELIRERERIKAITADRAIQAELTFSEVDALESAKNEETARLAIQCLDTLTAPQRSVVTATIMGRMSLSDWALQEGKTHQAASTQRSRALTALRKCVDHKLRSQQSGKEESR
jgi:DNA-directed RNA polymerase specialized sigma24 family protein